MSGSKETRGKQNVRLPFTPDNHRVSKSATRSLSENLSPQEVSADKISAAIDLAWPAVELYYEDTALYVPKHINKIIIDDSSNIPSAPQITGIHSHLHLLEYIASAGMLPERSAVRSVLAEALVGKHLQQNSDE
ncbi:hypothetical protein N7451_000595 [Penicillium sp. IBT 35674x]|nr:hypothetical protein N7451_000595 [Penicillium sp. IBT 35674x]